MMGPPVLEILILSVLYASVSSPITYLIMYGMTADGIMSIFSTEHDWNRIVYPLFCSNEFHSRTALRMKPDFL